MSYSNLKLPASNPFIMLMDKCFHNRRPFNVFEIKKVSESIYRGPRVPIKDMPSLIKNTRIKTILDLRTLSKKRIKELTIEAKKYDINYVNIPINPFRIKKSISAIVAIIKQSSEKEPLFIHCAFGIDRTGFVTALARHIKEKLPISEAIKDMQANGFRGKHRILFYNFERFLKEFEEEENKLELIA